MRRLMVSAMESGAGKTVLACALLSALKRRGQDVEAFKCGPDYIDPMYHRRALGVSSRNLDLFLQGEAGVARALARQRAGLAVIEGAMGLYDGVAGTDEASSWRVALAAGAPVVLAVRPRGSSATLAAQLAGLAAFREPSMAAGVVLMCCKPSTHALLKGAVERECGLPVLGYLPPMEEARLESRHLGLVQAGEVEGFAARCLALAAQLERTVDVEALLSLAAGPAEAPTPPAALPEPRCTVAVARDEAFSFYYEGSLDALREAGARLAFFSPLADEAVPPEADALYLGGGYPELHARRLAENSSMLESVRRALRSGMPCVAECGGFLYLQGALEDEGGRAWPMAGVWPDGRGYKTGGLRRFGYLRMSSEEDTLLVRAGERVPAHEFHHWDCTEPGADLLAEKPSGAAWRFGHAGPALYAGFPHLSLDGELPLAARLVEAAEAWRALRGGASAPAMPAAPAAPEPPDPAAARARRMPEWLLDPPALSDVAGAVRGLRLPDEAAMLEARRRWDGLAKPLGSLGLLEDAVARVAGVMGDPDVRLGRRVLLVMCADNGVVAEGVAQAGSEVTAAVARSLGRGESTVCHMARAARCEVVPVDIGVSGFAGAPGVVDARVRGGTADIALGPAMSREECELAVRRGAALARAEARAGACILCMGEMGIGNTTTTAAVAAALLGLSPSELVGRGSGLSDAGLARKRRAVEAALALNAPDPSDTLDVVAKVGGLDIAALAGLVLGAAASRVPVMMDGAISNVAALVAVRLCPEAAPALLASHLSAEPAARAALAELGLSPLLSAGMRLGEGSGAVAALPLLDQALAVYQSGHTFGALGMDPYVPQS